MITLVVGGVVLLLAGIVGAYVLFGRTDDATASPTGVVKRYLQALSKGDARTALSYGADQLATKEFLTADILKKQLAQSPITNIKIIDDDSAARQSGKVHVSATIGSQTSDANLEVTQAGSRGWKLTAAAVQVSGAANRAVTKTITIFGKPISNDSATYVFPGWVDFGSANPYVTVTAVSPMLGAVSPKPWALTPTFTLTDQGRTAVRDQLNVAVGKCEGSKLLAPQGCPFHLNADDFIEGSAGWGSFDISDVTIGSVDASTVRASFSGSARFQVNATTTLGVPKVGLLTRPLAGTADLTKTPPELSFD